MRSWFRLARPTSPVRRFRPRLEAFEDRTVPAAGPNTFHTLANTPLVVSAEATRVVETGDGEVTLPPTAGGEFSGTSLPADWQSHLWGPGSGGSVTVGGGVLTVDGAQAGMQTLFTPGRSLEFVATFTGDPFQHVGFGTNFDGGTPWAMFSTREGGALYARTTDGGANSADTLLTASLGVQHDFQIDWSATGVTYSVDGVQVATHAVGVSASMRPLAGDFNAGGGAVQVRSMTLIPPGLAVDFSGTSLPPGWFNTAPVAAQVGGGVLTVDGAEAGTQAAYAPGRALEFAATFTGGPFQHVGFATTFDANTPWAMISTGTGGALYARTTDGLGHSLDTPLDPGLLGGQHEFRIVWTASGVDYYVADAHSGSPVLVASHPIAVSGPMSIAVSDFQSGGNAVTVDWMRMSPFNSSGVFLSRVFDAGSTETTLSATWVAFIPDGTSLGMTVRTGNTPTPDATWTAFTPVESGVPAPGSFRYAQYRADLATTDADQAPLLRQVTLTAGSQIFIDTTVADFDAGLHGTSILAALPADNAPYSAVLMDSPTHGTLALGQDGSFTYTPAADYTGPDSFSFKPVGVDGTVYDRQTVSITVDGDARRPDPMVTVSPASGNEGAAIPLSIAVDPGTGSELVSVTIAGLPAGAALSHGTSSAGVWTLGPADLAGLTVTAPDNGTFDLSVVATARYTATGMTNTASATLGLTVANVAPTAAISSNSPVSYGNVTTVQLTGAFDPSSADTTAGLHYAFGLDQAAVAAATYNTATGTASANFSLPAGTRTVYARVIDQNGASTPYQIDVTVNKAVVTVTAANKSMTFGGALPALTAEYSGFVNGETAAVLTTQPTLSTTAKVLSPVGTYPITASGAAAANYTFNYVAGTLTVTAPTTGTAFVAPDPANPGMNAVFVTGTSGDDNIILGAATVNGTTGVAVTTGPGQYFVFVGQYSRIVVHGWGGNDNIWGLGPTSVATWMYGDDGNDRLLGGTGNAVFFGGSGDDLLAGGSGRNLMIGGTGADRMIGAGGDDVIIGGTTAYDTNEVAVTALMKVWSSSDSFATRVAKLTNTSQQYYLIQGVTVFNDSSVDQMSGGSGADVFYAARTDAITDLSSADKTFLSGP